MAMLRRLKQLRTHFGVSAPKLSVKTHFAWPWRAFGIGIVLAIVGWMVWTGYDAGRLLGGFYKSEAEERRIALETQVSELLTDNRQLVNRVTRLESEGQMSKGAQDSLARQALLLQTENTQLKEELSYLQQLVSGNSKEGAISVQRAAIERDGPDQIRVRMLVVQGGAKGDVFNGQVAVALEMQQDGQRIHLSLPDDQPETGMALKLNFKYYQRIDAAVKIPLGAEVRALQVRVFLTGNPQPRATQTVNLR